MERVVAVSLEADYCLSAEVHTVVRGVNSTLAVGAERAPEAYVRLYRPEGRLEADIAAELAVLDAVVATDRLDVARAVANQKGRLLTQLHVPGSGTRPMAVFQVATGRPMLERPDDLRAAGARSGHHRLVAGTGCGRQRRRVVASVPRWLLPGRRRRRAGQFPAVACGSPAPAVTAFLTGLLPVRCRNLG